MFLKIFFSIIFFMIVFVFIKIKLEKIELLGPICIFIAISCSVIRYYNIHSKIPQSVIIYVALSLFAVIIGLSLPIEKINAYIKSFSKK